MSERAGGGRHRISERAAGARGGGREVKRVAAGTGTVEDETEALAAVAALLPVACGDAFGRNK